MIQSCSTVFFTNPYESHLDFMLIFKQCDLTSSRNVPPKPLQLTPRSENASCPIQKRIQRANEAITQTPGEEKVLQLRGAVISDQLGVFLLSVGCLILEQNSSFGVWRL